MITLAQVKDWTKTLIEADHYYIGKLNEKYDRSIGLYTRQRAGAPIKAMGDAGSYGIKAISILVHWTNNANETEHAALALYDKMQHVTDVTIGDSHIDYIMLNVPEPVAVGVDDKGVYEYVIEADLYYRKEK